MTDTAVTVLTANEILSGLRTVQSVLAPDLTPEELQLFAMVANRSGLDPFAKQIYAVKRKGRVTFQTGIDGYRSIAARTGMYDGQDEPEYGPSCVCASPPADHPESATVRVYRKGVSRAIAATAFWHEYKPGDNDFMWVRMPRVMIAKVAEALALRKAFPYDPERKHGIGADVYTSDEMDQADRTERPKAPTLAERVASKRAEIETEPASGLSGDAFRAALERADIDIGVATAKAKELFPGVRNLDDGQRFELFLALTGPTDAPTPMFAEEEEAALDAAIGAA